VAAQSDTAALPMAFDISCGVRRRDKELCENLNNILQRRKPEIDKILDDYGVPRLSMPLRASKEGSAQ
jgi:mxaJ protein